ncbi:MAG TPA: hypothetical protein VJU54_09935 [Nitrospiraceae bacterium]|nr:hypothetical protein [Nitrospiraceae bacterium]
MTCTGFDPSCIEGAAASVMGEAANSPGHRRRGLLSVGRIRRQLKPIPHVAFCQASPMSQWSCQMYAITMERKIAMRALLMGRMMPKSMMFSLRPVLGFCFTGG